MGRKREKQPGLIKRKNIWHIDVRTKHTSSGRVRESTGESDFEKAKDILHKRLDELRDAALFGIQPEHTFREAATHYLNKNADKIRIADSARHLKILDPYIGDVKLHLLFEENLEQFIKDRKKAGRKNKTINISVSLVSQILNLAAHKWHDKSGFYWLKKAPSFDRLDNKDARHPYPLSIAEQKHLLHYLPEHLANMTIFKVNTGLREQEVCNLQWDSEIDIPELQTSVFLIPDNRIKNKEDRLVVLNKESKAIIDKMRGQHPTHVFHYQNKQIKSMNNTAWQSAREKAAIRAILKEKNSPYKSIDINLERDNEKIIGTVTGLMKDGTSVSVQYTSDDYNLVRKKKGLAPAKKSKRSDYSDTRVVIKREAIRRFINTYCPLHSMFCNVRVHDIKHTFGRRLRAARVSSEDRKILLGHTNGDITTHYSDVEIESLIKSANAINTIENGNGPTLLVLRNRVNRMEKKAA